MRTLFTDRYQLAAIVLVIVVLGYRWLVLTTSGFNLGMDEAQYWYWSVFPDFGYYSKPPLMAWLITAATAVCGDGEACVRAPALLIYPLVALIIYCFTQQRFGSKAGFYAAAIFFTMPGVSLGNILITTDAPLLLLWCLSLVVFLTVIDTNKPWQWIALGILVGLGLLSKYTMIFFAPSALLLLVVMKQYRHHLRNPWLYLSAGLALVVFLPNVIWNIQHQNPTLHHTLEISHLTQAWLQFDELFIFLLGQFGVFGFVSFGVLLVHAFQLIKHWQDTLAQRLLIFSLVFLGVICLQALFGSANANWAVPTYIAAAMLVGHYLAINNRSRLFAVAITLNLLLGSAVYHFDGLIKLTGTELTSDNDVYRIIRGWRSLGNEVQKIKANYPTALMLFDSRYELAELVYYLHPHPMDAVKWNPRNEVHDHFDLVTTMRGNMGKDFIYVSEADSPTQEMRQAFHAVRKLSDIEIVFGKAYKKSYHVFYLQNFRGYTPIALPQSGS